jgi:hypothetical protein
MSRNRMIKPDFWDDEKLSSVSRDARLTFIGLWTHADDVGVSKGNLKWLVNNIFPYDNIKPETFKKWINELTNLRLIMSYECNNEQYIHIRNFLKHQTINKPTPSKNPFPTDLQLQEYYGSSVVVVKPNISKDKIKESKGELEFKETEYYNNYELFKEKFLSNEDYLIYDVKHYFESVKNWSDSGGKKKKDWIATARNFARNDKEPKLFNNKSANIISIA